MKQSMEQRVPRGRPRRFDRSAALERALDLFWRRGYEATSLADLTAAMGIAPPSLYAAFGSKKQLFLEAVERYAMTHGMFVARALAEEPNARAAVDRLLHEAAREYSLPARPPGCLVISAATNCSPAAADVEATLRQRRKVGEGALCERIRRGLAAGELPAGTDVASLSKFYAAVLQGMSIQARDGASRGELESIARTAMSVWPAGPRGAPREDRHATRRRRRS